MTSVRSSKLRFKSNNGYEISPRIDKQLGEIGLKFSTSNIPIRIGNCNVYNREVFQEIYNIYNRYSVISIY